MRVTGWQVGAITGFGTPLKPVQLLIMDARYDELLNPPFRVTTA